VEWECEESKTGEEEKVAYAYMKSARGLREGLTGYSKWPQLE
jgi:hypothetical protein